ncbi:hypothetical protein BGZ65_011808, partial [Modicella reniformis]
PTTSVSSVHSLGLNAVGLYEVLCSKEENHFDVNDAFGMPLTSVARVTLPAENKRAVFGAFFDLEKIDRTCAKYGLRFYNRVVYVNQYTVRVVGSVIPNGGLLIGNRKRTGHPVVSQLEQRRKKRVGGSVRNKWTLAFFAQDLNAGQVKAKAEELSVRVKEAQDDIQGPRRVKRTKQAAQTLLRRTANRIKGPDRFKSDAYNQLLVAREDVRKHHEVLDPKENNLRELRRQLYYYNKLDKADKTPVETTRSDQTVNRTTPDWAHFTVEDDVRQLDISKLTANSKSKQGMIVFSGTDYGLCKMSETVALPRWQLEEHMNYYSVLSKLDEPETQSSTSSTPATATSQPGKPGVSRVPRSNTITAQQINE